MLPNQESSSSVDFPLFSLITLTTRFQVKGYILKLICEVDEPRYFKNYVTQQTSTLCSAEKWKL
jgi:hypothetical protein